MRLLIVWWQMQRTRQLFSVPVIPSEARNLKPQFIVQRLRFLPMVEMTLQSIGCVKKCWIDAEREMAWESDEADSSCLSNEKRTGGLTPGKTSFFVMFIANVLFATANTASANKAASPITRIRLRHSGLHALPFYAGSSLPSIGSIFAFVCCAIYLFHPSIK